MNTAIFHNTDLLTSILFCGGISLILFLSEWLGKSRNISSTTTRRFVHVSVGFIASFTPWIFADRLYPMIIGILFTLGNLFFLKKDLISSIHRHDRHNYGTIFFPLSFLFLLIFFWTKPVIFASAFLVMAIADPLASTIGQSIQHPRHFRIWAEKKSIEGSVIMFLTTFLLLNVILLYGSWVLHDIQYISIQTIFALAGPVSLLVTVGEFTSRNGSDNISIPVFTSVFLDLFLIQFNHDSLMSILVWMIISVLLFILTYRKQWLSADGTIGAWITGILIFSFHGLYWVLPLILFFVTSSLITKLPKHVTDHLPRKHGRKLSQVFANGGTPLILAAYGFYAMDQSIIVFFLAAIAASTADTWATELGMRYGRNPVHCLTFRKLTKGDSGGVSAVGLVGSFLGSFFIAMAGILFHLSFDHIMFITVAGFLGSVSDSILGGTVQAKYQCNSCLKAIEEPHHCNELATKVSGWSFINNDMVNFLSSIFAVIILWSII